MEKAGTPYQVSTLDAWKMRNTDLTWLGAWQVGATCLYPQEAFRLPRTVVGKRDFGRN